MPLQDKETLITNEKRQMLGELALFPLDNFVLSDQDILTSEFLKNDLEAVVQECTENGRFIVLNEMSVNAYAYSMKAANVVALSYGSLYHCLYAANLLMLSEEYYPEIGDVRACYNDVNAQDYPPSVGTGGETLFYISGDDERRNTGYIIAAFAMKYMVYHEIGHHECGHLQKYNLTQDGLLQTR